MTRVYERLATRTLLVAYGPGGRRSARRYLAIRAGFLSEEGDACPYHKRAYVAAWLHGIALKRGDTRPARVWRPRIEADFRRSYRAATRRIR